MSATAEAGVRRFALIGTPNSGKTALFNALTGSRQKVANYPGVTVERKSGAMRTPSGPTASSLIDLPGTYSLRARSPDEEITRDVVLGRFASETAPDLLVCVADATNLRLALRLVIELKQVGRPLLLVLNMIDIARRRGIEIDLDKLSAELGVPVVTSVAVRRGGTEDLLRRIDEWPRRVPAHGGATRWQTPTTGRSARRPARGRPADQGRRRAAGAAGHADRRGSTRCCCIRSPASSSCWRCCSSCSRRCLPGRQPVMDLISAGFDALGKSGARRAARRPVAKLPPGRRDLRRRQRARVPAADPDPVPVHPAAGRPRLHGARGLPDGPHHGRRRPARPRLHPAAVELCLRHPRHHGDARDRQPARPADHHLGGAADDLLGAHSGLHADHLGLHSGPAGAWALSACRAW